MLHQAAILFLLTLLISTSPISALTPLTTHSPRDEVLQLLHCGSTAIDAGNIIGAYSDLNKGNADLIATQLWLSSNTVAYGYSNGVQFYVCNNADSEDRRSVTLDDGFLDWLLIWHQRCGNLAFWVDEVDNGWRYGVDPWGITECGGL